MKQILIFILLLLASIRAGAQNVTYTYDNAGNRTERTVGSVVKSSQAIESQQIQTTLPNPVAQKDITVYPNPTQGHFTVDISNISHNNLKGEAYLFDAKGRLLDKKSIHSHGTHKKLEFNLTHHSAGTYLLNIRMGENTFTWKVIKK